MDCTPDSDQDEDATAKGHAVTMEKMVPANTREYRDLQVHLCAESQLLVLPRYMRPRQVPFNRFHARTWNLESCSRCQLSMIPDRDI